MSREHAVFYLSRFLGRRSVMIASAAVVIIAVGAGVGLYFASRSHHVPAAVARNVGPAPSVAPAGSRAVATPKQAVNLTVVRTVPADGSSANATDTPITVDFNLPVDATSAASFLRVFTTGAMAPAGSSLQGTVTEGAAPEEIVFKPAARFGVNVTVVASVLNGLQAIDGSPLSGDFSVRFTTVPGPRTVTFLNNDEFVRLVNAPSGRPVNLSIQTGDGLSDSVVLKTYKATAQDLLNAFVFSTSGYADAAVNTSAMTPVENDGTTITASGARFSHVQNGVGATVNQPDGLYVVVAADASGQYGAVWINFSRYALMVRQDDQRVVVAGEDLTTGDATAQFAVTFYSLRDGVQAKASTTFTGAADLPSKFPSAFDLAVVQVGGEIAVVPIAAPETNADVRITGDLSQQLKGFITTDRLAYQKGDTVRFAGAVRLSNDQVYALGAQKVNVWAPSTGTTLVQVAVAADGTFSGSFAIPAAAFNADGSDNTFGIMADSPSTDPGFAFLLSASTTVVAAGPHSPSATVTVALDKATYAASDTIAATVTGPASATVNVSIYASLHTVQPAEGDSFVSTTSWGDAIKTNVPVKLDATGHATYSFKANVAQKAADEEITVAATYGTGAAQAVGAHTAVVFQAADEVFLLPLRVSYRTGDTVVAPFVVEARDGTRVPNASLAFELDSTDYSGSTAITKVVGSGNVTTDANGLGVVRTAMAIESGQITLRVRGKDAAGNVFEEDVALAVNVPLTSSYSGVETNARLDIGADKVAYAPGDSAVLTVTSPSAETALLSLERGRVHTYRLVKLAKGDNTVHVDVTPDLAPAFNAVFSYFQGGDYTSQAYPVSVSTASRVLKVKLTTDVGSYTKGQTAHVTIAVTDAGGAAVPASALVDGYDAQMAALKLVDKDSIAGAFFTPNRLTTNASSSLTAIGTYGGRCGGGYFGGTPDPTFAGQAVVWSPDLAVDATGHATVDVPLATSVRLVVFVGSKDSGFGQAEIDINVP